ncbi:hypothetical protein [Sideroxydans lithotrophicus]|uniref:FAD-dependent pyridine nucleotide-disulfide oxidoreductase n=1 Tax=Sideroxydans lithotrophicus (strain ES-1) TaxID=580332 RepID=D5CRU7_SIDLE|nr:hypothetical protein [Sideroxydans lithotrophicus]ADE11683.1 conserved hypothetical protein [Sideroxydans lithotrophicus ES-1]
MSTLAASQPPVDRRKQQRTSPPKDYGWTLYIIVITLLMAAGFFISYDQLYKPGDNVGYNLGLAGGIMMLTLLIYPLRKRVGFMRNWSILPKWFKWHMAFGILGPALIVFHSTFTIHSINAGVAMACMLLVSGSGIFGRFFYTKIHNGLYGRKSSLEQMQANLESKGDVKSILNFAPELEQKLLDFRDQAMASARPGKFDLLNFIKLGIRAKWYSRVFVRELEDAMYADANAKQWNEAQMKRLDELFYQNERFIRNYLLTVRDLAQFSTYEKLFSLWHIFHVPLVYMLVFSAIWHVIAVHKY